MCTGCQERKVLTSFHRDKDGKCGRVAQCKSCVAAVRKAYYYLVQKPRYHPYQERSSQMRRKYGLTEEQWRAEINKRHGRCDICGEVGVPNRANREFGLCVDHDHATGAIRGFLCSNCNSGLGFMRDNSEIIAKALKYLGRGRA